MAFDPRRTPCVGICSTTYGDLVCRGCKRFAHEIVQWNGYSDDQRARVWGRLDSLRDGCVAEFVAVADLARLNAALLECRLDRDGQSQSARIYELLRRRARVIADLKEVGLRARKGAIGSAVDIRDAIDAEMLMRSRAAYEHSFHTPVD